MDKISEEEFARVVADKRESLFRLAYSILKNATDAEDAVAEAVLNVGEKRDRIIDTDKFHVWLIKITTNTAKSMHFRKRREVLVRETPEQPYFEKGFCERAEIWEYVIQLKRKYMILIILFYYYNMSIHEIAQVTDVPEGTVKSRLYRAKQLLKKIITSKKYNCYDREGISIERPVL